MCVLPNPRVNVWLMFYQSGELENGTSLDNPQQMDNEKWDTYITLYLSIKKIRIVTLEGKMDRSKVIMFKNNKPDS